jgi:hypothetical protein
MSSALSLCTGSASFDRSGDEEDCIRSSIDHRSSDDADISAEVVVGAAGLSNLSASCRTAGAVEIALPE